METINIKDYIKKIIPIITKEIGIDESSLCFCGSGIIYKKCCLNKESTDLIFCDKSFEKAIKHRDSKNKKDNEIPGGIFKDMKYDSLNRLKCLYPHCNKKTSDCHLIPANILGKHLGKFCLEFKIKDGEHQTYEKTGKNEATTLPVFCNEHDNNIFKKIDEMKIDFYNKEHLFLLAFRAISFSLRKVQYLLGIDSQSILFSPKRILENPQNKNIKNIPIDISHLKEQYTRFRITHDVFKKTIKELNKKKWEFFSHFYRNIEYNETIFCSGFLNISHDLENNRINILNIPVNMTLNLFTKDKKLHFILSCPGKDSKKAYAKLFKQLKKINEKTFISVINNLLTISSNKPIIPLNSNIGDNLDKKIKKATTHYKECMRSNSNNIFNLKEDGYAITFIKK